jgi:hypothetical protein
VLYFKDLKVQAVGIPRSAGLVNAALSPPYRMGEKSSDHCFCASVHCSCGCKRDPGKAIRVVLLPKWLGQHTRHGTNL